MKIIIIILLDINIRLGDKRCMWYECVRVCVCDDLELLTYYLNSMFGCALMYEVKQQL